VLISQVFKSDLQVTLEGLGAYAVPILTIRKLSQTPYMVGTGSLYRVESGLFLITAKHVVDALSDGRIVTSGKTGFVRFDAEMAVFEQSPGRDHDICVVRLLSAVVESLSPHLKVVEDSQLACVAPYDKLTLYAFVGYPHSRNRPRPRSEVNEIRLKPVYYLLREFLPLRMLTTSDKCDELHVAFNAPSSEVKDVNLEKTIQAPKPNGISGCGVWMIKLNKTTGLVEAPSLVGVGIEYLQKDKAFVATRIDSPIGAIKQFQDVLRQSP